MLMCFHVFTASSSSWLFRHEWPAVFISCVQPDLMQLLAALSVRTQCLTSWWMPSLEWMSLLIVVLL